VLSVTRRSTRKPARAIDVVFLEFRRALGGRPDDALPLQPIRSLHYMLPIIEARLVTVRCPHTDGDAARNEALRFSDPGSSGEAAWYLVEAA